MHPLEGMGLYIFQVFKKKKKLFKETLYITHSHLLPAYVDCRTIQAAFMMQWMFSKLKLHLQRQRWMGKGGSSPRRQLISRIQLLITLVTLSLDREELHSQPDGDSALYLQVPGCRELALDNAVKLEKFPRSAHALPQLQAPGGAHCCSQGGHPCTPPSCSETRRHISKVGRTILQFLCLMKELTQWLDPCASLVGGIVHLYQHRQYQPDSIDPIWLLSWAKLISLANITHLEHLLLSLAPEPDITELEQWLYTLV